MQNVTNKHGVVSHLDVVFAIQAIKTRIHAFKKGSSPYMSLTPIPTFRIKEIAKSLNLNAADYHFNYGFDEFYNDALGVNFVSGFYLHITPKRGDRVLAVVGHYADFKRPYKIAAAKHDDLSELSLPIEM